MKKTRIASLGVALAGIGLLLGGTGFSWAAETWECALDLQQGDKGSLSLQRTEDDVTGIIRFDRNGSQFEQEVEGRWSGREIDLTRLVDASSSQAMHAIAVRIGTKQIKMGGRFGDGLTGVWSADCALLGSPTTQPVSKDNSVANENLPSISMQASPFRPSSKEKIEFASTASHPDGIRSVALFLNDREINNCDGNSCSHTHKPLADGIYNWHVIAISKSGVQNTKNPKTLVVKSGRKNTGVCSINGLATGAAVAQSTTVTVQLSGSGKSRSTRFDAGVYAFNNVPAGKYELSLDISTESGLLANPTTTTINCAAGQTIQQNFEMN